MRNRLIGVLLNISLKSIYHRINKIVFNFTYVLGFNNTYVLGFNFVYACRV